MNALGHRNAFGTLLASLVLASLVHTPFSHDAFLVVDLSNSSYRSLGHVIRTGSTPLAASKLHPGTSSNYRDHSLAQMTRARGETANGRNGGDGHRSGAIIAVSPFRFWLLAPVS